MPKLSIIVVNFRGGQFVDLLLTSLAQTMPATLDYIVIVVDNYITGYRSETLWETIAKTVKHRARTVLKPSDGRAYEYRVPPGVAVVSVVTSPGLVIWSRKCGLRGKASSLSHAKGLTIGYGYVPRDCPFVLLLDQDVAFLKRNWVLDFFDQLDDQDVVLVGTFREETIYERPFLRPFCLMFRNSFYLGINNLFDPTPQGDTCSLLTYWCED